MTKKEIIKAKMDRLGYRPSEPIHVQRDSVDQVFMKKAMCAAGRSPDGQTQHGCVIVTPDNRVLSTGYNGFPRDIDYSLLPNTRPDKYPWMRHAERNALAWCEKRPLNCSAYVTGECCNECLMTLWQHGIIKVVELNAHGTANITEEDKKIRELFIFLTGIEMQKMDFFPAVPV